MSTKEPTAGRGGRPRHEPHIFVDADACPVKGETLRVAGKYGLSVTLVSNSWMRVPEREGVRLVVVEEGLDAADDWIVEHLQPADVVVSADVPLAARCLAKGALVIGHSGKEFTEAGIGGALATRNLLADLRDLGTTTRGPAPFTRRDRSRFLQRLDAVVHAARRRLRAGLA